MILTCLCGRAAFTVKIKSYPAVKDDTGKIVRAAIDNAKVMICGCGRESLVYMLQHPDSKLEWKNV